MGDEGIMLDQEFIVLAIPAESLSIEINAKVWDGTDVVNVSRIMDFAEVREAIEEARTSYIPEDAIFTLTEIGKAEVDRLIQQQRERFDE